MYPHGHFVASDEEKAIRVDAAQDVMTNSDKSVSLAMPILDLDEKRIFAAATDYQSWTFKNMTLKSLPAFDDSTSFGITVDDENTQIREEIAKMVHFVSSSEPPLFDSHGILGITNVAGFEDLHNVADQILCNLHILMHDNACLALDHYVEESFYNGMIRYRSTVRRRYLGKPDKITGNKPKVLTDEIRNVQAYHHLVDFILQSLAWWLMNDSKQNSWRVPIIAVLSRWSVKLKLIALDPIRWAERSLGRAEDTMRRISHDQKEENRITIRFPAATKAAEKVFDFPDDRDWSYWYYSWKFYTRENLYKLVYPILSNLMARKSGSTRSTSFEVRTLMYRSVLDNTLRHLTVQWDGSIEMSSEDTGLRCSYRALQLLLFNAKRIAEKGTTMTTSEVVKFYWHMNLSKDSNPKVKSKSVTTDRLDDIVSTLIPLGLAASSKLVYLLDKRLFQRYYDDHDDESPTKMQDVCAMDDCQRIEFYLSTGQGEIKIPGKLGTATVPASRSPLITSMEDLENELDKYDIRERNSSESNLRRAAIEILQEYQAKQEEIKTWAVTEDTVRVRTVKYSTTVLITATAIIGGALAVPFIVKEGIKGVDPFQFVSFGWLLAGSFLVISKGRYVENWPWHDMLRGQVVCRSVSELAKASNVKEQTVLLHLLHQEFGSPLTFNGPYHGMFKRRVENGGPGFAINVPTGHATVLAAGFIVLEVLPSDRGEQADGREGERKVYTELKDTRKDTLGASLIFNQDEGLDRSRGKQKFDYGAIRLKLVTEALSGNPEREIVGLPTADYEFI